MFFVTLLLNAVISWMRQQSGTSSLRALLYMDEVFGYLPPTANPPSKVPMLTLLKQARAFGLGLVLATQNPVDLDYKALSNAGTWFLGRLQTERDKLRVLDGLEGASTASGLHFQRDRVEKILSGLSNRVFLMNNVHDNQPVVFQTRWALSYLRGPLSREQMQTLSASSKGTSSDSHGTGSEPAFLSRTKGPADAIGHAVPPVLPQDVGQKFAAVARTVPRNAQIIYCPALAGKARVHFVDSKADLDAWRPVSRVVELVSDGTIAKDPWSESVPLVAEFLETDDPVADGQYADCPAECAKSISYRNWGTSLKSYAYQHESLELSYCPELKLYSTADEREGDFKGRLALHAREVRDLEMQKLQRKYESRLKVIQDQLQRAEDRLAKEQEQANSSTMSAMLSFGTTIAGALFGRKKLSAGNVSKAATSLRSASRASEQRGDVDRAKKQIDNKIDERQKLEDELELELQKIKDHYDESHLTIERYAVAPRKSDTVVEEVSLLWLPFQVVGRGELKPAFDERALGRNE